MKRGFPLLLPPMAQPTTNKNEHTMIGIRYVFNSLLPRALLQSVQIGILYLEAQLWHNPFPQSGHYATAGLVGW